MRLYVWPPPEGVDWRYIGRGYISADELRGRTRSGARARFSDWLEAGSSGAHAYDDQWEKQARAPDRGRTQSSAVVRVYVAQAISSRVCRSSRKTVRLTKDHVSTAAQAVTPLVSYRQSTTAVHKTSVFNLGWSQIASANNFWRLEDFRKCLILIMFSYSQNYRWISKWVNM